VAIREIELGIRQKENSVKPRHLVRIVSLLVLASAALTAQVARQATVVPLKNWAAPLYWQPSQAERGAVGRAAPQFKFSANAVSADALTFVAITPCRLVDTRGIAAGFNGISPFSGPSVAAAGSITIPVQSATEATANTAPAPCGVIPSIAEAYSFNLTVVPHAGGAVDYVSLWPAGGTQPFVSTLDDPQGAIVSNAAIVPAGTPTGGISVFNSGPAITDVIVDMNGYYAAPTDLNGNTAIGAGTLAGNTTGNQDTAVGFDALGSNTTGAQNTATGSQALQNNTTGSMNTASGTGALYSNTTGGNNTASGAGALESNTTGGDNTAVGDLALLSNSTGSDDTASGSAALISNTTGNNNTASGAAALYNNATGNFNTASGSNTLFTNTTGSNNTASGYKALHDNTTGGGNTADGASAMQGNTSGNFNTASGYQALQSGTSGSFNTANGYNGLLGNTTGHDNTASGASAMQGNTTGNYNTADGVNALISNMTGSNNIAIGFSAATNVASGNSNNIHIGNSGASGDSATIKIGTLGTQTSVFIAGISGATSSGGAAVFVNSNGQLGTVTSSRRFKEQITDMGETSSMLFQLRPVNFFYKPEYDDGSHLLQYGLIAEEVEKIYPEMVAYDGDGQILTVKYQMLAPMLLNEVQKQNAQIQKLQDRLAALEALLSGQKLTADRPAGSQ
jgi:hypothetical protein